MDLFKKALSTTHLRDRHIIYQELVKRQVNNHLSKGIIDSTFKEMAQNAEKLQTEELSDFIQAVLEGKEPPKMTLPQLQVYELAVKSNVNLSCQDLLEEMFAFAKGIEESATFLERMGLNVEIASVFRDKIVKVAESYRTSLSPYKDKVKEDHLNDKFPRGILHFLILHHTGEIYKQDHFTHGSKFYSHEAKHAKEFLDVAKGFIAAARITIKEKPEEGERLLQLIKTAYVDQYMYLGWFNRRDDAYYRVQALIELGEVAHEFGLPCASSFKKEARQLKWDCLFGDPRVPSLL
jgi:hypothetical protein